MAQSWIHETDRGSGALIRFMAWLTQTLGWHIGRALLYPITAYFFLSSRTARVASSRFLTAVLSRPPTWREGFQHLFTFASTILDRVFFLTDRLEGYDIRIFGVEAVTEHLGRGKGCILLGSHLGSFEVLRAIASRQGSVRVKALMHERESSRLSEVLRRLNRRAAADVIRIGTPGSMLQVKECLEKGELIGILADRLAAGDKVVRTDFLGATATFPAGPFILSHVLDVPIVLFFGLYRGGRRYDIHFEKFAQRVSIERAQRDSGLFGWVQRYAQALERFARAHPYNWFNFYDFWESADGAADASRSARP